MQINTPLRNEAKKPADALTEALCLSFIPRALESMLPAPCPNIKPIAWMIDINPNTIPTAPLALVPS